MELETGVVKAWEDEAIVNIINLLAFDIAGWAEKKGFWNLPKGATPADDEKIGLLKKAEKNALVTTEVAEHLEALRKPNVPSDLPGFTAEEEEIADAIIRLLDYAGHYNLRIGEAIAAKMQKNESRPYMHGKTF